jgi:hypothetical protein
MVIKSVSAFAIARSAVITSNRVKVSFRDFEADPVSLSFGLAQMHRSTLFFLLDIPSHLPVPYPTRLIDPSNAV